MWTRSPGEGKGGQCGHRGSATSPAVRQKADRSRVCLGEAVELQRRWKDICCFETRQRESSATCHCVTNSYSWQLKTTHIYYPLSLWVRNLVQQSKTFAVCRKAIVRESLNKAHLWGISSKDQLGKAPLLSPHSSQQGLIPLGYQTKRLTPLLPCS